MENPNQSTKQKILSELTVAKFNISLSFEWKIAFLSFRCPCKANRLYLWARLIVNINQQRPMWFKETGQVYPSHGFSPGIWIWSLPLGFVTFNIQLLPLTLSSSYYQDVSHILQLILIAGNRTLWFHFFLSKIELSSAPAPSATVVLGIPLLWHFSLAVDTEGFQLLL